MRRVILLSIILASIGLFQAWFLEVSPANVASRHSTGTLTDLYTEGLSMGQSYLPVIPDAHKTWEIQKYQILDASYYGDRVYLYFGITPFAGLIIPWHLLTGTFLSDGACILVFLQFGYLFYGCALWLLFRSDRHPTTDWFVAASFLATVVASGTWSLIGRPAIYEIEAACGYACFAVAVASFVTALNGGKWVRLFLGGAAFFSGLTMGCRPNYLPAVGLMAVAIGCRSWALEKTTAAKARDVLVCWFPLVIVGVSLATWNYIRFSSIFEFGYGYTGFVQNNRNLIPFSPGNILYNLHRYLFGGFHVSHYFPFIDGVGEGPIPLPSLRHQPVDQIYGSLILFPVLGYALLPILKKRPPGGLLLLAAGCNLFVLLGLGYGTYRYPADYLGILSFVAGFGICCIPNISRRIFRLLALGLMIPALIWSVVGGVCLAASIARTTNLFEQKRPRDFSLLSYPFNVVAYWVEGVAKTGPVTIRLRLVFPRDKIGKVEPLMVAGGVGLQDFIYVYYVGPKEIEVGFESIGYGGPVSGPMKMDYNVPHTVDISLGSFLPPDTHPLLEKISPGDISIARDLIHIEIDKNLVIEATAHLHSTRSRILIGESPDNSAFGQKFTGSILKVERPLLRGVGIYPRWETGQFGPVAVTLKLRPMPIGTKQPLISVGYRPVGGILFFECAAPEKIRLGWQVYNQEAIYSPPVELTFGRPHRLEVYLGSLLPPTASSAWPSTVSSSERDEEKGQLRCLLDGREIWRLEHESPDVSPASVIVGRNSILQSNIADSLNGDVGSVTREAW